MGNLREWRWACDCSMKRANPSPCNTNPLLGLSAIAVTQMLQFQWIRDKNQGTQVKMKNPLSLASVEVYIYGEYYTWMALK